MSLTLLLNYLFGEALAFLLMPLAKVLSIEGFFTLGACVGSDSSKLNVDYSIIQLQE